MAAGTEAAGTLTLHQSSSYWTMGATGAIAAAADLSSNAENAAMADFSLKNLGAAAGGHNYLSQFMSNPTMTVVAPIGISVILGALAADAIYRTYQLSWHIDQNRKDMSQDVYNRSVANAIIMATRAALFGTLCGFSVIGNLTAMFITFLPTLGVMTGLQLNGISTEWKEDNVVSSLLRSKTTAALPATGSISMDRKETKNLLLAYEQLRGVNPSIANNVALQEQMNTLTEAYNKGDDSLNLPKSALVSLKSGINYDQTVNAFGLLATAAMATSVVLLLASNPIGHLIMGIACAAMIVFSIAKNDALNRGAAAVSRRWAKAFNSPCSKSYTPVPGSAAEAAETSFAAA